MQCTLVDKAGTRAHNIFAVNTFRISLAAAVLLWAAIPAPARAALDRARFESALVTARDYAADRSLMFYCLRASTERLPFVYAGLQSDLERAVQKMKAAGASPRQSAEVVQTVLSSVRFYGAQAKDASLDRRCIAKDVERSSVDRKGVGRPLDQRPPYDQLAPQLRDK